MRPLADQTILISGATDGLGKALAAEFAATGARLLLHDRDDRKGADTVREIQHRTRNGQVHWHRADLSSLRETADLAQLAGSGVTVNCLHPATLMPTKMVIGYAKPRSSVEDGLRATMRLIVSPAVEAVTGKYYDGLLEATASAQANDEDARQQLQKLSDQLTGPFSSN